MQFQDGLPSSGMEREMFVHHETQQHLQSAQSSYYGRSAVAEGAQQDCKQQDCSGHVQRSLKILDTCLKTVGESSEQGRAKLQELKTKIQEADDRYRQDMDNALRMLVETCAGFEKTAQDLINDPNAPWTKNRLKQLHQQAREVQHTENTVHKLELPDVVSSSSAMQFQDGLPSSGMEREMFVHHDPQQHLQSAQSSYYGMQLAHQQAPQARPMDCMQPPFYQIPGDICAQEFQPKTWPIRPRPCRALPRPCPVRGSNGMLDLGETKPLDASTVHHAYSPVPQLMYSENIQSGNTPCYGFGANHGGLPGPSTHSDAHFVHTPTSQGRVMPHLPMPPLPGNQDVESSNTRSQVTAMSISAVTARGPGEGSNTRPAHVGEQNTEYSNEDITDEMDSASMGLSGSVPAPEGVCTITEEGAQLIFIARAQRKWRKTGLAIRLGAEFGISATAVRDIWRLRTWAHATWPYWTPADRDSYRKKLMSLAVHGSSNL
jgi:hypothetical protein